MKKLLLLLLLIPVLALCSCEDTEETTEAETHPPVEITTAAPISIEEMSPSYYDPALPFEVECRVAEIPFGSFTEIEAKDSVFPDSLHDKILKSENAQYFFVDNDIKIHAVFFDENEQVQASASYNIETGAIEFFGDATRTWYFDENGEVSFFVYTYDFNSSSSAPIYTFYDSEGNKDVTRTMEGWYSADLSILDNEEVLACLEKYEGAIESTAEYESSNLAE